MTHATSPLNGPAGGGSGGMARLFSAISMIARFGLWLGGGIITLAALLIGCDVTLRVVLGYAIDGTDELARFALAISTTWALAGALLDRAHIRVDTAYARFPGTMRLAMDLAGLVAFFLVFALIFYYGLGLVGESWANQTRSPSALQVPMVIPQAVWLLGITIFLVADLVLFAMALKLIFSGRSDAASALIGMKSAEEEVQEELDAADAAALHERTGS
ncbi:TRAP transporter small permease subunit [Castellaniella denitrificans]|uniref:TRAP transporter small permease subunit n=1 Tax=Castellaniella denitrificans TaxID=56119 RepID=UPI001ACB40F6|nr:TRAP transporter small permease [Burkholderiales bacterium]